MEVITDFRVDSELQVIRGKGISVERLLSKLRGSEGKLVTIEFR